MKRTYLLFLGLLSLGLVLFLAGCDIFGVSIEKRLEEFVADLNRSEPRYVNDNFHSAMPGKDTWNDTAFSTTELRTSYQPFSLSNISAAQAVGSYGGFSLKYVEATLNYGNDTYSPTTIRFNLAEETPGTWYILAMDLPYVGESYWGTVYVP